MKRLTRRQTHALQYITDFIAREGIAPSRSDLADGLQVTRRAAHALLHRLAERGHIELIPESARGIRLKNGTRGTDRVVKALPLLGRIAAGTPLMADEHIEEFLEVDPGIFSERPDWLFRVQGESMINLGLLDGDLAAIRKDPQPPSGSIVAALVPDPRTDDPRWTLKRYRKRGHTLLLISENDDQESYPPQVYAAGEAQLMGRYVGMIRRRPRV